MRKISTLIFVLLFPILSFAQGTEEQTASPVTQEDLKRATAEMKRTVKSVSSATAKLAEEARKARESAEEARLEALRKSEEKAQAEREVQLAKTAEAKANAEAEAGRKMIRNIGISLTLGTVVIISFFYLVRKSRRKYELTQNVPQIEDTKELTDLEIKDLDEIFEKYGSDKIKTVLKLRDGRKFICYAHRVTDEENHRWMASIGTDQERVAWKNRRKRAEMLSNMEIAS